MRFAEPDWLYGLFFIPLLAVLFYFFARDRKKRLSRFADEKLWKTVIPNLDFGLRRRKEWMIVVAFAFLVLALARPQWGTKEESVKVLGLDLVFTLDISNSMNVEDVVPSRLKMAKHFIRSVVERLPGDRVALVPFAASNFLSVPLTTDTRFFLEMLETMDSTWIKNQGTDIGLALETSARALDRAAVEENTPKTEGEPTSRVVVLISDGEDLEERVLEGVEFLQKRGVDLFVFGVGTQKGGPIPNRGSDGRLRGYIERKGKPVISQFHPEQLASLAEKTGHPYRNLTGGGSEVAELLRDLGALDRNELAEKTYLIHQERYQIPLAIALLLLFVELCVPSRRLRGPTTHRSSRSVAMLALSFLLSGGAQAEGEPDPQVYLENKKGLEAYRDGRLNDAREHFGRAQAEEPNRSGLLYNQGVVQLNQENYDGAIYGFGAAAGKAAQEGNWDLAGKSFYNLGDAFEKKGNTKGAVQSYLGAIQAAQKSEDETLEKEARQRLEILAQRQQQKKQQKQSGDGESGDNQDQQDQNQNQDQKNDQKQASQKQQKKKDRFQSEKLSKEDAKRVMAELMDREKDLQKRFKRQDKKGSGRGGRNW